MTARLRTKNLIFRVDVDVAVVASDGPKNHDMDMVVRSVTRGARLWK